MRNDEQNQAIVELAKREAQRKYQREWRKNNPDKVKANQQRYWEKKGIKIIGGTSHEESKIPEGIPVTDGGRTERENERRFPASISKKEYEQLRYNSNYRGNFLSSIRSWTRTLQALGVALDFPDDDIFQANVDAYLATRPRRPRIDWESQK